MNQMFVIDIYLNKFKNHFCSINPRFFRYFACGLNGFNSHQWIKYGFVAFAVAIALASLLFSNKLVRELTIEERNKIEIWAKATEHLATETDNSDMNLVLRILQGNTTIPVILYEIEPKFHCQQHQTSRQRAGQVSSKENGGIFQKTKCH